MPTDSGPDVDSDVPAAQTIRKLVSVVAVAAAAVDMENEVNAAWTLMRYHPAEIVVGWFASSLHAHKLGFPSGWSLPFCTWSFFRAWSFFCT